jgi:hypothetical protein
LRVSRSFEDVSYGCPWYWFLWMTNYGRFAPFEGWTEGVDSERGRMSDGGFEDGVAADGPIEDVLPVVWRVLRKHPEARRELEAAIRKLLGDKDE